jgi:hypothetical protein
MESDKHPGNAREVKAVKQHKRSIPEGVLDQIESALAVMRECAMYDPAAPSDGVGNITQPIDERDLSDEALRYAKSWWQQEDDRAFRIGCANYEARVAMVYAIEIARLCCGGFTSSAYALLVARQLLKELEDLADPGLVAELGTAVDQRG